jgi:hypothetical protein
VVDNKISRIIRAEKWAYRAVIAFEVTLRDDNFAPASFTASPII